MSNYRNVLHNKNHSQEHRAPLLHRRLDGAEGRAEDPEPERVGRQEEDGAADRLRPSHQLRQGRQEAGGGEEEGCGTRDAQKEQSKWSIDRIWGSKNLALPSASALFVSLKYGSTD